MTGPRKPHPRFIDPPSPDYEVGYGKTPAKTRFKPGKSGNPLGRPKGSKKKVNPPALNEERLKAILLEEAYRPITVNDPNGQIDIPMAQAIVRSVALNAAKGSPRSQRLFTELLASVERDNMQLYNEYLQAAIEYKINWGKELDRRKALGITWLPDPLPHPDHVVIDMRTGSVEIRGPITPEDKALWDALKKVSKS